MQDIDARAPMTNAVIHAIGTMLAAVARILRDGRHWLSVARFLIVASLALALLVSDLVRAVRDRAVATGCVIATPFSLILRHLSRPPQVWAGQ
ncbi:hypothetical protein [Sphingomonas sp.]|uniref:hypothetical protein n=1 Tax=Sphingomonas sp. TaxID=28214 RepID=UPI0035C79B3A